VIHDGEMRGRKIVSVGRREGFGYDEQSHALERGQLLSSLFFFSKGASEAVR
jgi:hypothetical protein